MPSSCTGRWGRILCMIQSVWLSAGSQNTVARPHLQRSLVFLSANSTLNLTLLVLCLPALPKRSRWMMWSCWLRPHCEVRQAASSLVHPSIKHKCRNMPECCLSSEGERLRFLLCIGHVQDCGKRALADGRNTAPHASGSVARVLHVPECMGC